MQRDDLTLRIEMFGNMVQELSYWTDQCNDEMGDNLVYCEQMFDETLDAVKAFREILLDDLYDYRLECKEFDIPEDISYYRILKQLEQSTFEVTWE